MPSLLDPLALGRRTAPSRVLFGPHETNLARRRAIADRHVAYYRARAAGGAGVIVTEEASVHASDWPYERAPLAADCGPGWEAVAEACHAEGALVLAAIGHAGGQGSSAYSQAPLWAPSRVPEVNSREVPKWMEEADVQAVLAGFEEAARLAVGSGCDGVDVNAGQLSLVRQFLSGLTNHRGDTWGQDRLAFARAVLAAVRRGAGPDAVVGLRLSCDELAPWAGLTPEMGAEVAAALAGEGIQLLTVVRGSIYTVGATRPDCHVPQGFNLELCRQVRAAVQQAAPGVAVVAQGSIVDPEVADAALADGTCDAVEMTRAQIADPALVRQVRLGRRAQVRPCTLCNQTCQVRDPRNPIVTCIVEPRSGHETEDPEVGDRPSPPTDVLVVGGGVAGLECARVAACRGHRVVLAEASDHLGGTLRTATGAAGRDRLRVAVEWLEAEVRRLGVDVQLGRRVTAAEVAAFAGEVVLCTGSLPGRRSYAVKRGAKVVTAAEVLDGAELPEGPLAIWDPIGGPIGVSVAESLRAEGREVALLTPDLLAGNELARTGDLAPANVRLLASGVAIEKRSILRAVAKGWVEVEDRFTGEQRKVPAAALVDAGHRLPDDRLWRETGGEVARAGDAVAPRSVHEAILEGRRRALEVGTHTRRPMAGVRG